MASLNYSIDAQNVLNKFHRSDYVVYVEGDDDVRFWEIIFDKMSNLSVHVSQVGGKEQLTGTISDIISGKLNAIVAMDTDFSIFRGGREDHPKILYTAGYSIENTLITGSSLAKVARSAGRLSASQVTKDECQKWLDAFYREIEQLVYSDITDQVAGNCVGVLCCSCHRFFANEHTSVLSYDKIQSYLKRKGVKKSIKITKLLESIVQESGLNIDDFVRGHFLASAASRYVHSTVSKIRSKIGLSGLHFYSMLVLAWEGLFDKSHPHYVFYEGQLSKLQSVA